MVTSLNSNNIAVPVLSTSQTPQKKEPESYLKDKVDKLDTAIDEKILANDIDFYKKCADKEKEITETKKQDRKSLFSIVNAFKKSKDKPEVDPAEAVSAFKKVVTIPDLQDFFLKIFKQETLNSKGKDATEPEKRKIFKDAIELEELKLHFKKDELIKDHGKAKLELGDMYKRINILSEERIKFGETPSLQEQETKLEQEIDKQIEKKRNIKKEIKKVKNEVEKLNPEKYQKNKEAIHRLEETAKLLGVKVKLTSKDYKKSHDVIAALRMITDAGFDLTGLEIRITSEGDKLIDYKKDYLDYVKNPQNKSLDKTNYWYPGNNLIYLRKNDYYNAQIETLSIVGNYLSNKNRNDKNFFSDSPLNDLTKQMLKKDTSIEFDTPDNAIKCIFTGLALGEYKPSPEVMGFYEAFGGPMTDKLRQRLASMK